MGITLLAVAAALGLSQIRLPGSGNSFPEDMVPSIAELGLMPLLTSCFLVEVGTLLRKPWRDKRVSGPGRSSIDMLAILLSVPIASAQGLALAIYLAGMAEFDVIGWASRLSIAGCLVLGALSFVGLSRLISTKGLGNGVAILLATEILQATYFYGRTPHRFDSATQVTLGLALIAVGLVIYPTIRVLSKPVRGSSPFRIPLAGTVPLLLLASLPAPWGYLFFDPIDEFAQLKSYGFKLPAVLVLGLILARVFFLPKNVAGLASRGATGEAEGELATGHWSAMRSTIAFLAVLLAADYIAEQSVLKGWFAAAKIAFLVALALDVVEEWRGRMAEPDLVQVWSDPRVYAATYGVAALQARGIAVVLRGLRVRSLLQFWGPHVPIEYWVARDRRAEAEATLKCVLGPEAPSRAQISSAFE